jgi:hypothetical protein
MKAPYEGKSIKQGVMTSVLFNDMVGDIIIKYTVETNIEYTVETNINKVIGDDINEMVGDTHPSARLLRHGLLAGLSSLRVSS